ncbi:MAG: UDP-N-acetylmuramoyl-tripeptide--D-alanyl-D-alanine ligase [Sphingomonadales bacterium]|nr:UDP-N-acetylmuramoyl-tripeptide--D-alanyl-D-alanine ligase [Sphingomonadales bacterium]
MELIALYSKILITVAVALFAYWRLKTLLMFFQQEEYDSPRFLRWIFDKRAFDITASLLFVAVILFLTYGPDIRVHWLALPAVALLGFTLGTWRSLRALKSPKKPLVMTARAKRIFVLALAVAASALYALWDGRIAPIFDHDFFVQNLILVQTLPLALIVANLLLMPYEASVRRGYLNEAKAKMAQLEPTVIAISGSYRKTSTKHILAHILGVANPTLMTPGSVNTEMGVTRIIREKLNDQHRYFVVEMGAYGPGSIAKLCALTPPSAGMITSIGVAHLERFKTIDTVFQAKFELADAVKAKGGKTIVNVDRIPERLIAPRLAADDSLMPCGKTTGDVQLVSASESIDGLSLTLKINGSDEAFTAPIYGLHQAENIMLSVAVALELGYPISTIRAALISLPQTRHRLEVTQSTTSPTVIDDAYNSNPTGFDGALQTLKNIGTDGHRYLITPGMVELGDEHDAHHRTLGEKAGGICDVILAVTPERIPTFVEGAKATLKEGGKLLEFATQLEAETWLRANTSAGDVVLYENNLPDLFEAPVRF